MTIDPASLQAELALWLGPAVGIFGTPSRLSGGESAECYRFEVRDQPPDVPATLVLRLQHDDRAAARECAIQASVAAAGFAAPRVLHVRDSLCAFGRPYAVIEFIAGRDPVKDGALRSVPAILAETMLALHALDPRPVRAALARSGCDGQDEGLPRVLHELTASVDSNVAGAARGLTQRVPDAGASVVCHGDLHGFNLLLHKGQLQALLDWELATLAPREYDVARTETLFALMPGIAPAAIGRLMRWFGVRAARQFVAAYEAHVRLDRPILDFCRALHALRLIDIARTPGTAQAGVYRLWAPLEPVLAQRWTRLTGQGI